MCAPDGDFPSSAFPRLPKGRRVETPRRDAPVTCRACGKRVPRKGRSQAYCGRRCRQRAYWDRKATAKISASVTHDTGRSTIPYKLESNINGLRGQKPRSSVFGKAPLNLLGGGQWRWPDTPQLGSIRTKIVSAEVDTIVPGGGR
jgi:hypothetical protein